jgi:hypothetical protein
LNTKVFFFLLFKKPFFIFQVTNEDQRQLAQKTWQNYQKLLVKVKRKKRKKRMIKKILFFFFFFLLKNLNVEKDTQNFDFGYHCSQFFDLFPISIPEEECISLFTTSK